LKKVYWDDKRRWVKGYFISTVGIKEKIIKEYVKMEEKEDTGQAELEFGSITPVRVWISIKYSHP